MLDLVIFIFLLFFILLIMVICGILIKLEDGGFVFYCGKRLGKDGKVFKMYKLRIMKVNVLDIRNFDGLIYNVEDDLRFIKIGKFLRKISLDELF